MILHSPFQASAGGADEALSSNPFYEPRSERRIVTANGLRVRRDAVAQTNSELTEELL
jgi:hypothetical protein